MKLVSILRKVSVVGTLAACFLLANPSTPSAEAWHGPFFHAGYGWYGPRVSYRVGYVSHYRYPYATYGAAYYPGTYRVVAPYSYSYPVYSYAYPGAYYTYPGSCYGTGYYGGAYYGGPAYYPASYGVYYGW